MIMSYSYRDAHGSLSCPCMCMALFVLAQLSNTMPGVLLADV